MGKEERGKASRGNGGRRAQRRQKKHKKKKKPHKSEHSRHAPKKRNERGKKRGKKEPDAVAGKKQASEPKASEKRNGFTVSPPTPPWPPVGKKGEGVGP